MGIKYNISIEEAEKIKKIRKTIKNKKEDKRLHAIQLRSEGKTNIKIAEKLDTSDRVVSRWVSIYIKNGIEGLLSKKQKGNRRNLSIKEEKEFLKQFEEKANKGQVITAKEIEKGYIELVGHSIGGSQIYRLLKRHGWRKVMPRSKHPKKASEEVIEASKKLNQWKKN